MVNHSTNKVPYLFTCLPDAPTMTLSLRPLLLAIALGLMVLSGAFIFSASTALRGGASPSCAPPGSATLALEVAAARLTAQAETLSQQAEALAVRGALITALPAAPAGSAVVAAPPTAPTGSAAADAAVKRMNEEVNHLRSMQRIMQNPRGGSASVECLIARFSRSSGMINSEAAKINQPQAFKNEIIAQHRANFGLQTFVETGTYHGDTIAMQLPNFKKLYSIELDDVLYAAARKRFAAEPTVNLIKGDAALSLAELLPSLDAPAMFWLDGHYSGSGTAYGMMDTPIIYELMALFSWPWANQSVILIDDIRLFSGYENACGGSPHCYPSVDDLRAAACVQLPELNFDVFGGMAALYPTTRNVVVPPHTIPQLLVDEFSLGGAVPISLEYVDATHNADVTPAAYGALVAASVTGAAPFDTSARTILRTLLSRHVFPKSSSIAVFSGCGDAPTEALALALGASVTSLRLCTASAKAAGDMSGVSVSEARAYFHGGNGAGKFALVLAADGAVARAGLGSYGEAIYGGGDAIAMAALRRLLAPGGLLVLSVPAGGDALVFNTERRYGKLLWPRLVDSFEVVDAEGVALSESAVDAAAPNPVWLLRSQKVT